MLLLRRPYLQAGTFIKMFTPAMSIVWRSMYNPAYPHIGTFYCINNVSLLNIIPLDIKTPLYHPLFFSISSLLT